SCSCRAPTPSGVTAPIPVMTTRRFMVGWGRASADPANDQVSGVADGRELLHVLALEHNAVLVLNDLGELDEIERIDIELLEGGVAGDLIGLGAEARERLDDAGLD